MVEGEITADRVAFVPILVMSRRGDYFDKQALLDTGFTEALALPPDQIQALELEFAEERAFLLADDSSVRFRLFRGLVIWGGIERSVLILESEGPPTVGTWLLYGYDLQIHWVDGGKVLIAPDEGRQT